jgi:hypothetical protein
VFLRSSQILHFPRQLGKTTTALQEILSSNSIYLKRCSLNCHTFQRCHIAVITEEIQNISGTLFMANSVMARIAFSLGFLLIAAMGASTTKAEAPVPVVNGYVTAGFEGWSKLTDGLPDGVSYVHRPDNRQLAGAFAWFQTVEMRAAPAAFLAAVKSHKIEKVRIVASRPVKGARFLDSQGSGTTLVADGVRNRRPIRIVAFVFYGSTNGTPRTSGVHGFAAPTEIYESMGGWVVPAALWMNLDPQREVKNSFAQGKAAPDMQATRFANIANLWSQWALNTMKGLAQGNAAAMSSARQTMICAGDPACRLVPVN